MYKIKKKIQFFSFFFSNIAINITSWISYCDIIVSWDLDIVTSLVILHMWSEFRRVWPSWCGWVYGLWTRWAACAAWCHCSPGTTRDSAGRNPGTTILNKQQTSILICRGFIINALSGSGECFTRICRIVLVLQLKLCQ